MRFRRVMPTMLAAASAATMVFAGPASATDHLPGRFTGGGRFYSSTGVKMTHGFELHCNIADGPNSLEVNWNGNQFHLENMTWASCSDRPNVDPAPPVTIEDVHNGHGYGRLNGVAGAYADWRIIDKGEPGTADRMAITIWDAGGNLVIQTTPAQAGCPAPQLQCGDGSLLDQGNHQAH